MLRDFSDSSLSLDGKSVLVTGGTGSFGQAFINTVLTRFKPSKLIIFSRDEFKQSEMRHRFSEADHPCLRYFIGDVRDRDRLEMAFRDVDIVVHAAALKQVPAAEYNPFECIKTNVVGAENVVQAAITTGVDRVLALSTDKAANPVNLYGASKLASDKIFVAANHLSGKDGTRFSVVRYGNVIGSNGSVVPLFKKLVAEGATELPITDARMTRFWITLEQGVEFVLSNLGMMTGGEVYVPKIPSMKILDVVEAIAPGMPVRNIGIRPGEKLHEIMITVDDARSTVELADRYVICPQSSDMRDEMIANQGAKALAEDFFYSSDANSEWMTADQLRNITSV